MTGMYEWFTRRSGVSDETGFERFTWDMVGVFIHLAALIGCLGLVLYFIAFLVSKLR